PGRDRQPLERAPGRSGRDARLHLARPLRRPLSRGPRGGDVSGEGRGVRAGGRGLLAAVSPVHGGAALGGAPPPPGATAAADRAGGPAAERRGAAGRLPVQPALPPEGRLHRRRHAPPAAEAGAASPPRLPHSHRGVVATPAGGARSPLVRRLPRPSPDM